MENIRDFFLLYKQGRKYVPGTSEQILTRPKHITKRSVEHMAQWSHALSQLPNGRWFKPRFGYLMLCVVHPDKEHF